MPSLPPALNPWMMRPRAGQRNSGSVPAASACAPVSGVFDWDAPDSRLPVGVLSIAGFLASDDLDGSASATLPSFASRDADFSASLPDLSALALAFSFSLSFAFLADLDGSASATSCLAFCAAFSLSVLATAWSSA